jgi:hypothetical protein
LPARAEAPCTFRGPYGRVFAALLTSNPSLPRVANLLDQTITLTVWFPTTRPSSVWAQVCNFVTSTQNRLYIGWFGVIMVPTLLSATTVFIIILAPTSLQVRGTDRHSHRPACLPVRGSCPPKPSGFERRTYQFIVCHFRSGLCAYMGREWELSFRLGMRPWIAVAYSAPVAAATVISSLPDRAGVLLAAMHGSLSRLIRATNMPRGRNQSLQA